MTTLARHEITASTTNSENTDRSFVFVATVKPPNSEHCKQRICLEQQTNCLVPNVTIFVKLPPNSGHLSVTDKFFKTRRCPLFRGFTVFYVASKVGVFFLCELFNFNFDDINLACKISNFFNHAREEYMMRVLKQRKFPAKTFCEFSYASSKKKKK